MKENLSRLQDGQYPTMNGTRYVLTEFHPRTEKTDAYTCIDQLLSAGFIPLIAHAERYQFINPDTAAKLRNLGAFIQINAFSVCEDFKESIIICANQLLHAGLVDYFGSDAHRMDHRPPKVLTGAKCLYSTYDREYVDHILFENARDNLL